MTELTLSMKNITLISGLFATITNTGNMIKKIILLFLLILPIYFLLLIEFVAIILMQRMFYKNTNQYRYTHFTNGNLKTLRDEHIDIEQKTHKFPLLALLVGKPLKRILTEIDDLLDDFTLITDDEFKSLVMQIANKYA